MTDVEEWKALPQAEAMASLRAGLQWRAEVIRELQGIDAEASAAAPAQQVEKRRPGRPSNEEKALTARQQQLAAAESEAAS